MKVLTLTLLLSLALPALLPAQSLNSFRWKSRLVLCFTPDASDPIFERQVRLLYDEVDELQERDVTFIFIAPDGKHENSGRFLREANARKFYERFGVAQYQFELVLVGYDGYEKYRAINRVTPPSVLLELIDEMPMRRRRRVKGFSNRSTSDYHRDFRPTESRRKF